MGLGKGPVFGACCPISALSKATLFRELPSAFDIPNCCHAEVVVNTVQSFNPFTTRKLPSASKVRVDANVDEKSHAI
jgi:hypothetical protein